MDLYDDGFDDESPTFTESVDYDDGTTTADWATSEATTALDDPFTLDWDGDGISDIQFVDLSGDGLVDAVMFDLDTTLPTSFDATAPWPEPVDDVVAPVDMAATAWDVVSNDVVATDPGAAGPFPVATDPFAPIPMSSGTAAVLDSVNQLTGDATLLYHDAMDPGSVDPAEVDAALQRADNLESWSTYWEGQNAADEIRNDVNEWDQQHRWEDQAREDANAAWIDADRAISKAEWAVWESEQEL
jgi:hypothetical protein